MSGDPRGGGSRGGGSLGGGSAGGGSSGRGDSGMSGIFDVGTLISYTYRVEALLARGGMGEVYRTTHTEIGTQHAIKIVRPDLANNEKIMELFRREASVLRTVRDDAIVGYDGVLRDEEGRVYLVMEFVDGPSLTEYLNDRILSPEEVRALRDRLAHGLAAAHDKGVIHRDMSPDNIILGQGKLSQAKIIDFGIAKLADSSATTIIGDDFAGRYAYASPEQIGLYGGQVDARSDIYSLGLVLATAGTGRALNMGEINESLVSVIEARKQIPDFTSVPEILRNELGAMLQPDPADRPQSMREVIGLEKHLAAQEAAEDAAEVAPAAPPKPSAAPLAAEPPVQSAPAASTGRPWLWPALATGVILAAGGGYFAWQSTQQQDQRPITAEIDSVAPAAGEEGAGPPAETVAEAPPGPQASETAQAPETAPAPDATPAPEAAAERTPEAVQEAPPAQTEEPGAPAVAASEPDPAPAPAADGRESTPPVEAESAVPEGDPSEIAAAPADESPADETPVEETPEPVAQTTLPAGAADPAEADPAEADSAEAVAEAGAGMSEVEAAEAAGEAPAAVAPEVAPPEVAVPAPTPEPAADAQTARNAADAPEETAQAAAPVPSSEASVPEAPPAVEAASGDDGASVEETAAAEAAPEGNDNREPASEATASAAGGDGTPTAGDAAADPAADQVADQVAVLPAPDAPAPDALEAAPEPAEPEPSAVELRQLALQAAEAELSRDEKREIQRDLQALGHYRGGIDGSFGPGTRAGIERYQQVAGLDVTGYLNDAERRDLAEEAAGPRAEAERLAAERAAAEAEARAAEARAAEEQRLAAQRQAAQEAAARARAVAEERTPAAPTAEQQASLPGESELDRLRRIAEGGDPLAQASLGLRYYRGQGVRRDLEEAVRWTERAAQQGEARAQSNLGFYYMNGEGVQRDPAQAARWWREAAAQGLQQAQFNLGLLYETGRGVAADPQEAAKWYRLAIAQGDRQAKNRLDNLVRRGLVSPEN